MGNVVDTAVTWAISIANDDSHGYDQGDRWGKDYDCSSLVIQAYENGGAGVKSAGATYTGDMCGVFLKKGFTDVTKKVNLSTGEGLIKGDVLWRSGHTAMMISSTKVLQAHSNEKGGTTGGQVGDQTGKEIDIRTWYTPRKAWTRCLRYKEAGTDGEDNVISKSEINKGNRYLSLEEMRVNAQYILNHLTKRGWSKEAVCALLGNMQTESTINPEIWQSLNEGNTAGGFGLVQWTPATKLIDWAIGEGFVYTDIDTQLARLIWEVENGGQYYATDSYPLSFEEFTKSTQTPEYLAKAFIYNYERPASYDTADTRAEQARYWFDLLTVGSNANDNDEPETVPDRGTHHLSKLLLFSLLTDRF